MADVPPPFDDSPDQPSREQPFDLALVETPAYLFSEETDAPFQTCIDCGRSLSAGQEEGVLLPYMVQKLIVRNESVFEFALPR